MVKTIQRGKFIVLSAYHNIQAFPIKNAAHGLTKAKPTKCKSSSQRTNTIQIVINQRGNKQYEEVMKQRVLGNIRMANSQPEQPKERERKHILVNLQIKQEILKINQ